MSITSQYDKVNELNGIIDDEISDLILENKMINDALSSVSPKLEFDKTDIDVKSLFNDSSMQHILNETID